MAGRRVRLSAAIMMSLTLASGVATACGDAGRRTQPVETTAASNEDPTGSGSTDGESTGDVEMARRIRYGIIERSVELGEIVGESGLEHVDGTCRFIDPTKFVEAVAAAGFDPPDTTEVRDSRAVDPWRPMVGCRVGGWTLHLDVEGWDSISELLEAQRRHGGPSQALLTADTRDDPAVIAYRETDDHVIWLDDELSVGVSLPDGLTADQSRLRQLVLGVVSILDEEYRDTEPPTKVDDPIDMSELKMVLAAPMDRTVSEGCMIVSGDTARALLGNAVADEVSQWDQNLTRQCVWSSEGARTIVSVSTNGADSREEFIFQWARAAERDGQARPVLNFDAVAPPLPDAAVFDGAGEMYDQPVVIAGVFSDEVDVTITLFNDPEGGQRVLDALPTVFDDVVAALVD